MPLTDRSPRFTHWRSLILEMHPRNHRFIKHLRAGATVLDLGSGRGLRIHSLGFLRPDIKFYAVDKEDCMKYLSPDVEFRQLDLCSEKLPFANELFDGVLFSHVLEHLDSPELVAAEIHRVLRPGGLLYVEVPNIRSIFVPSIVFAGLEGNPFNFFDDSTHRQPYTKNSLAGFVLKCNMEIKYLGIARNPFKVLASPFLIPAGMLLRRRNWVTTALWDLVGWCIYAVGVKASNRDSPKTG